MDRIRRRLNVLLVEDQPSIRRAIVSEFAPDPDFEIVGQAASLTEARRLLANTDVAILDLGLPDGSGADLIPELLAVNPTARAIVLTATNDPAQRTRAIERGAAAVLDKVTHLGQVPQAVRRVLARERRQAATEKPTGSRA